MMNIDKIKDYWMATMATDETREIMEEIWSTEDGMQDLTDWFEAELELGLTEEEMDEAIESTKEEMK